MAAAVKNKSTERYVLEGVRELNLQWLELLAAQEVGGSEELSAMLQRYGAAVRQRAAAGCPFALVDFEFANGEYWRQRQAVAKLDAPPVPPPAPLVDVARSALTLAWWSARADIRVAEAILGIAPDVSALIRDLRPAQIERIARCGYGQVRHRGQRRFLEDLLSVAKRDTPKSRRAIYLRGLHWLAGECTHRRISQSQALRSVPHRFSP